MAAFDQADAAAIAHACLLLEPVAQVPDIRLGRHRDIDIRYRDPHGGLA